MNAKRLVLLTLQPNPEDQNELASILTRVHLTPNIIFVNSENELLEYLKKSVQKENKQRYPSPNIMLLNLDNNFNSTYDLIDTIKYEYKLKHIPIVLMCNKISKKHLNKAYSNGVNSVIRNPMHFDSLVDLMNVFDDYWFGSVQLP